MAKGKKQLDKTEELKNHLARALADYDNLKKRVEREQESARKIASLTFIIKILPILDMLIDAQEHLKDSGLALTIKEFEEVLSEEGVEKVKTEVGQPFDEETHEAVEAIEKEEGNEGKVAKVVLSGWRYKDGPVIRPTKVVVYKRKEKDN